LLHLLGYALRPTTKDNQKENKTGGIKMLYVTVNERGIPVITGGIAKAGDIRKKGIIQACIESGECR